jgi:hypothetical protein
MMVKDMLSAWQWQSTMAIVVGASLLAPAACNGAFSGSKICGTARNGLRLRLPAAMTPASDAARQ